MIDGEQYIDTAIATLKDDLPARLAAIDAEHTDFELDVPADNAYSLGSSEVLRFPWIEVALVNSDIDGFDLGQGSGDQRSTIIIACRYQHGNGEHLDRALRRYARAVMEVLMAPDAFGPHETVSAIRVAYGTNPEFDEKMMLNGVAVCGFTVDGIAYLP